MRRIAAALVLVMTSAAAARAADDSNGAARFAKDIVLDYKHFFSIENAEWLGLGAAAAGGVHAIDEPVAAWVQREQPPTLPGGYEYGSQLLHIPVAAAWWAIAHAAGSSRHAAVGRDMLRAQLLVGGWTYGIKVAADRTRPNGESWSFPSGHASTSFTAASVLQEHYGWKVGAPAYVVAVYTAVSRIGENAHWMSDVAFGAALGISAGRTVTLHVRTTRVSFAPLAVPGGGGVLVTALR